MLVVTQTTFSQDKSIVYFNESWEETNKENASFYRNLPLEEKDGNILIKDYYISGKTQFIGWAKKENESFYDDEIKWFYENGNTSSIRNYKDGDLDGERKEFYENGITKTITKYKKGKKEGDTSAFNQDGSLLTKGVNKDGKPYEGSFLETTKKLKYIIRYKAGLQTQVEVLFANKTIAKGILKNEKPYQGSFIGDSKVYSQHCKKITTLKNGKEEGKQIFKDIGDPELYAYYYAKDGVNDGKCYYYDYDDDKEYIVYYKKGKPFEGELLEKNRDVLVFKKGVLESTKKRIEGRGFTFFEIYKNDKKVGVEYLLFEIDGKNTQTGFYKNEKPYQGYFSREGRFEFPILDYYEKGEKKYQYAKGYNKIGDAAANFDYVEPPFKSVYKNGVIYTGAEYDPMIKNPVLVTRILNKGRIDAISLWVFAMHYGNNIVLKRTEVGLQIQEMENPNLKIKVDEKHIALIYKDSLIIDQKTRETNSFQYKTVLYYLEEGTLKDIVSFEFSRKAIEIIEKNDLDEEFRKSDFVVEFYTKIPVENTIESVLGNFDRNIFFREKDFFANIYYNSLGKPSQGFLVTQEGNVYNVDLYFNNELKASKNNLNVEELTLYIKDKYKDLEKMYEENRD